ncbi:MAG: cysteine hydrolase [Desulfosarcina sp.]|nr:cysteine hydrolase [Desulfosarcina sp.]MBC2744643.1 cysteine hydrolase [Desulfosarcina sp.]MBC2767552.1 cysteine hydrolase [Desulfosarcina sp.]
MNKYTKPNFESSAVITIDTQCDTLDGQPLEIPGTSDVLPNIKKILGAYREKRMPIVHIVRIYKKDGSNVDLCRKEVVENGEEMLLEGSSGCELASEMFQAGNVNLDTDLLLSGKMQEISNHETIIYKPRWGAFYETPLESHLKRLRVDTLVYVGCNFPNCPRTSIYEASERDFKIVLVEDAISGLYSKGKEEMLNIGVLVVNAEAIENAIIATSHFGGREEVRRPRGASFSARR